jgi:alkylhydroperoxidase family enzyme
MPRPLETVEAIALLLAYVAYADNKLDRAERDAIADAVAALVETQPPGPLGRKVEGVLSDGKHPLKVARACLALAGESMELRCATLRAAWLVARSHDKATEPERARIAQLARDLGVDDAELARLTD